MMARLTIYQRIVALTAAAILLSLGAMMIVTFRGPPPVARPMDMDDLQQLLAGHTPPDWHITSHRSTRLDIGTDQILQPELSAEVARDAHLPSNAVGLYTDPLPPRPLPDGHARSGPPPHQAMLHGAFTLAIRRDGSWFIMRGEQRPAILRWYAITFGLMTGVFILLMLPVRRVARTISDPISRLADAAEEKGDAAPLAQGASGPDTPPEVRALVSAMEGMQRRIREQDRDRAAMLRAIAHDLRTPMTRLSFRVDKLPDDQRDRAQADISEMRSMIAALLDFMDGHRAANLSRVEAVSLIEALVEGYREQGDRIDLQVDTRLVLFADAALLRRALQNVVDNALRYAGTARISIRSEDHLAHLIVDDEGPGIPASVIARATEPFWRGEASRARTTGGVGLGLAIVQEAMTAMNGQFSLENRTGGGLRATLSLPLAR